ncbi:MAG: Lipid-A-disaccharide synthase [Bacteroidetes bacterium ADurb.Bin408]|nr:MAG: Lipid-A-disaccharide synthase [Bacteroidetes bacterium ADurb.Bin408]
MRYYIIAGEASGDLHASNMMKALGLCDKEAVFRCWGGDRMKDAGGELVKHYKDLAFMGFLEVVMNLRTIMHNFKLCETDLLLFKPDALILIDYPGFNLRMARFAHQHHIPVYYYISPQVWAWKASRVRLISKVVRRMCVILPFEEAFYARYNYKVDFVGHPLIDALENEHNDSSARTFNDTYSIGDQPLIALLPGSRLQEIKKMLPLMLKATTFDAGYQYVVCAVESIDISVYNDICKGSHVKIITNDTYNVLRHAHAAMVTSGTATLETALFNVPQVVCYNAGYLSYVIAKNLVKLKYISLVNLIMDKKVVTELIQSDFNANRLLTEMKLITGNTNERKQMLENYATLRQKLGGGGASANTAAIIYEDLKDYKAK